MRMVGLGRVMVLALARWCRGAGKGSDNQQCGGSWNGGVGEDKHVMKLGGGGLIVIMKLSNFNRDTALMPINTHPTDVELMMTCIISDSSDMMWLW